MTTNARLEMVQLSKLRTGPFRRGSLSGEQMKRLRAIRFKLSEVDTWTEKMWVDDFRRDPNPDRELAIWEMIADAFSHFCDDKSLTAEEKEAGYRLLLQHSMDDFPITVVRVQK